MTNRNKTTFWQRHFTSEAGFNLSWGSVIAGVITFFAVFLLFSIITAAIGLGTFSPTSDNPMAGVGTGTLIWTIIAMILSLLAGGFVAGLAARRTGLLHGFLTWALSLIIMFWLLTSAVVGVTGALGNVLGSALGVAGNAVGSVADVAGDAAGKGLDALGAKIGEVDTDQLQADVQKVLKDTDVKELQPEYLSGQLQEAKDVLVQAAKDIAVHPENADQIIDNVSKDLQARAETIGNAADRDAIKNAVAKNTELSQAEADKAVDNIYNGLQKASQEAQKQVQNAEKALVEAKANLDQAVQQGRETAEKVSNAASGASIWLFIGLLLGAIITSFAGYLGSEKVKGVYLAQK